MFKICPNCGAHNLVTANFCVKCGTNLADVAVTQAQTDTASHTESAEKPTTSSANQSAAPVSAAKEAVKDETANSASTASKQPNPTVEAGKKYAGSYWRYLVDSIKHPAHIERSYHPYFGFTSLAITIISLALTIALRVSSTLSSLPGGVANIVVCHGRHSCSCHYCDLLSGDPRHSRRSAAQFS